jgi:hypothetical protein
MSRVWKRFLKKISYAMGFVLYFLAAIIIPEFVFQFFDLPPGMGATAGVVLFLGVPVIGLMIRDVYRDSKREVEDENRRMMRTLGKKFD